MRYSTRSVIFSAVVLAAVLVQLCLALDHVSFSLKESHEERLRLVKHVNTESNSTWAAGINEYFRSRPIEFTRRLCGARAGGELLPLRSYADVQGDDDIPAEFDIRTKWPKCKSVHEIRDQSACGSCWAIAAAEVASDRICAATGKDVRISTTDILACCTNCGYGCMGGFPSSAFRWLTRSGAVTGGDYGDMGLCYSYPFPMCDHHADHGGVSCDKLNFRTPRCQAKCDTGSNYTTPYAQDKFKFKSSYSLRGEKAIQRDMLRYGSVEAVFDVYSDFELYKSGVYQYRSGAKLGAHAVKIVGWGVDNGVKYWTVANSWNTNWGEKGYFRILRGVNHLGIESDVTAGTVADQ